MKFLMNRRDVMLLQINLLFLYQKYTKVRLVSIFLYTSVLIDLFSYLQEVVVEDVHSHFQILPKHGDSIQTSFQTRVVAEVLTVYVVNFVDSFIHREAIVLRRHKTVLKE